MPEQFCEPYKQCEKLDGRLLINQTLQGPTLAVPGDIGIGDLAGKGVLRPYCHFMYLVRWIPREACKAPVRSVIGLAPGETMSLETRHVEQFDYTRLVQDAVETSEVVTTSGPASQMRDREGLDATDAIWLGAWNAEKFGSWLGVAGAVVGGALGGPIGAGIGAWVGGAVDNWLDGDSDSGNHQTQDAVDDVLESVTRAESQRTVTETTTSRSSLFERTVSRTFTNPYRDRSLQLRFIPVFRRFEVQTVFFQFIHGLVLEVRRPRFKGTKLSARLGDFIQRQVADPRIVAVASSELGLQDSVQPRRTAARATSPLNEHLNANAEFYAGRYLRHLDARRDLAELQPAVLGALNKSKGTSISGEKQNALRWSETQVRGTGIHVPLAGGKITARALGMRQTDKYLKALDRIESFKRRPIVRKRDVHLFMGTHVEPVAGECKLEEVPEP